MTNAVLSNAVKNEKVILWQYDKASNLVDMIKAWNKLSSTTIKEFWDYICHVVCDIDEADDFGLTVLGRLIGVSWPSVKYPDEDTATRISSDLYRRIIKSRFAFLHSSPTVTEYNRILGILFGFTDEGASRCKVIDGQNMSMAFSFPVSATQEEAYCFLQHHDLLFQYPAGIRTTGVYVNDDMTIGFEGQDLENFANIFAWAEDDSVNGGIFAGTPQSNYNDVTGYIQRTAYIIEPTASSNNASVSCNDSEFVVDWGDGNVERGEAGATLSHTYTTFSPMAICAMCRAESGGVTYQENGTSRTPDYTY